MLTNQDTIAAIATPPGAGGVGIVRLSGAAAPQILSALFKRAQNQEQWESHRLYLGRIIDPASGALLDEALAVLMRGPHSYTREHVAELHCHGGPAVLRQVLAACLNAGARLATRGEFTLRAFLNGALSLDEAEAVADLVAAPGGAAARLAARHLAEGLGAKLAPLEEEIISLLAALTVGLDFPEDADVPATTELIDRLQVLRTDIAAILAGAKTGRIYREGYSVVLAGASNVGKSSLLNRLLSAERAIVSAAPGTTRDIIEESLDLDGLTLVLRDTAGLRPATPVEEAEQIGIERSKEALKEAQLALIVIDAAQGLDGEARALLAETQGQERLLLVNKIDLADAPAIDVDIDAEDILPVSAKTGAGLPQLLAKIRKKALGSAAEAGREPLLANARHQQAIEKADACLAEAIKALQNGLPLDMAGIDIENAAQALGEISGKTVSEEVISNIFANFCLGK